MWVYELLVLMLLIALLCGFSCSLELKAIEEDSREAVRRRQEMGRSRATKPTLAQKKLIRSEGLDTGDWLVLWENHSILQIVHRTSGSSRSIRKSPQLGSRRA